MSKGRRVPSDSGRTRPADATATAAMGTLMKKIQRHPGPSERMPPSTTPATDARPVRAPHTPSAFARSSSPMNVVVNIDRAAGAMSAEPKPWTPRAANNTACPSASPPASEASPKIVNPICNMRRRPNVSARREPNSRKPPSAVPYKVTMYGRFASGIARPRSMEGSATFTMLTSRNTMNWAMHRNARTIPGCRTPGAIPGRLASAPTALSILALSCEFVIAVLPSSR